MHVRSAWSHSPALPEAHRAWPAWASVALGGSALALADLAFASLYWFLHSGLAPVRIGQAIASWVLGSHAAHAGGVDAAIAGALLYCATVAAMVAGYMRLTTHWPRLHAHAWIAGSVYGIAMYALLFEVFVPVFLRGDRERRQFAAVVDDRVPGRLRRHRDRLRRHRPRARTLIGSLAHRAGGAREGSTCKTKHASTGDRFAGFGENSHDACNPLRGGAVHPRHRTDRLRGQQCKDIHADMTEIRVTTGCDRR